MGALIKRHLNQFQGIKVAYGSPPGNNPTPVPDRNEEDGEELDYGSILIKTWSGRSSIPPPPPPATKTLQPHAVSTGPKLEPVRKAPTVVDADHWDELEGAHEETDYMEDVEIRDEVRRVRVKMERIAREGRWERERIVGKEFRGWWEGEGERRGRKEEEEGAVGDQPLPPLGIPPPSMSAVPHPGPRGVSNQPAWMTGGVKPVDSDDGNNGTGKRGREEDDATAATQDGGSEATKGRGKKIKLSEANREVGERKDRVEVEGMEQRDIRERNRREDQEKRRLEGVPVVGVPGGGELDGVMVKVGEIEDIGRAEVGVREEFVRKAFEGGQMRKFVGVVIEEFLGARDETMTDFVIETGKKGGGWKGNMKELWGEMEIVLEDETGGMMEKIIKGAVWIGGMLERGEGRSD